MIFTQLAAQFGISGMVVIVMMYIFVVEGSKDQHRQFIDKFILLKFGTGETFYLTFLLVIIAAWLLYTRRSHRKEVKLLNDRITELQKEKNTLQAKLLK